MNKLSLLICLLTLASPSFALDSVYCNGQRMKYAGDRLYPNAQRVKYAGDFLYPNAQRVSYAGDLLYPNRQRFKYAGDEYYMNGRRVSYAGGLFYPNGQRVKFSGVCYHSNGTRMGRCPNQVRYVERIGNTKVQGKLSLAARAIRGPLELEVDHDSVITYFELHIDGRIGEIGAYCSE